MAYGAQTTPPRTLGANQVFKLSIAAFLLACAGVAVEVDLIATLKQLSDPESVSALISKVGPLAVVVLPARAVVVSPIPRGPVAMAAGAIFGALEGSALTAVGAVLGAFIAILLSRSLGYLWGIFIDGWLNVYRPSPISIPHNINRRRHQIIDMVGLHACRLLPSHRKESACVKHT